MLLVVVVVAVSIRIALPSVARSYVNHTINRNPNYAGEIGDVDIHLWRGAYSIESVRISKTTVTVPVPLFTAKRLDLAIQWDALFEGEIVGRIEMEKPVLNFVDGATESEDQTGGGGPWLEMLADLFPFKINRAAIHDGTIHFHAYGREPEVDVYLANLEGAITNLTNIREETTPLISEVTARGMVMDQAPFEFAMKLDPFSYYPTFEMGLRVIGLDVTKLRDMNRAYGKFDFERGWLDLIIEMQANEGQLEGYVKPLFRDLKVLSFENDLKEDDLLNFFWEALVGAVTEIFENQPRDQFGTRIPVQGDLKQPNPDLLAAIGNVLRNAFVRAYVPELERSEFDRSLMQFDSGTVFTELEMREMSADVESANPKDERR